MNMTVSKDPKLTGRTLTNKMLNMPSAVSEIFRFFFRQEFKAKRTRIIFILSAMPFVLLLIAKIIELSNPGTRINADRVFGKMVLTTYIQLLIPILGLMFGSRIISEEVDRKTLVFLNTCPIPKPSVILGKYLAYSLLSLLIVCTGVFLCFITVNLNHIGNMLFVKEVLGFILAGFMGIIAYMAFFTFLGTVMKKAIIPGLMYVFLWEKFVQFFPGVTQKFSIIYFINALLPITPANKGFFLVPTRLEPTPAVVAIIVMLIIVVVCLMLSFYFFKKREYPITDAI